MIIFCFHRISDEYSPAYPPIPTKAFDRICSYISRKYITIPLEAINEKALTSKKRALITFDDAFYDFYENALPVLTKYHLPSVQHVITSCADTGESFWTQRLNKIIEEYHHEKKDLYFQNQKYDVSNAKMVENTALNVYKHLLSLSDKDRNQQIDTLSRKLDRPTTHTRMMTWDALKDSIKYNVHVGSHTISHNNLALLKEDKLLVELQESRTKIIQHLGDTQGKTIAYPNGQWTKNILEFVKKSGYQYGFTTESQLTNSNDGYLTLPRLMLYHKNWIKNYLRIQQIFLKNTIKN